MRESLRAGIAIYNDGYYHAAHDAWENHWLDLERGTNDEQLLHGLIQYTAAVYHATRENWEGAVGLAESALAYLDDLPDEYRGVDLPAVRDALETLASDPAIIDRSEPQPISHEGETPTLQTLTPVETWIAATVFADAFGYDDTLIERAIEYARTDLHAGRETSPFVSLLFDFVREADHRDIVANRLSAHVDRRHSRESDVEGLFD